jgi:hypothetical protein
MAAPLVSQTKIKYDTLNSSKVTKATSPTNVSGSSKTFSSSLLDHSSDGNIRPMSGSGLFDNEETNKDLLAYYQNNFAKTTKIVFRCMIFHTFFLVLLNYFHYFSFFSFKFPLSYAMAPLLLITSLSSSLGIYYVLYMQLIFCIGKIYSSYYMSDLLEIHFKYVDSSNYNSSQVQESLSAILLTFLVNKSGLQYFCKSTYYVYGVGKIMGKFIF